MKIIFHSYANKTHFHKKGFALGLMLKLRVSGTRKWPIASVGITSLHPFTSALPDIAKPLKRHRF